ncbi:non-heme iron oxygenase ferredoxin subunit [Georgenia faecalis]|uniref:Non-heme iron oxygenase ferredoxin subunit n=1 Tax=Georgenia faecalis TaxID=2483799 RepID=A0ABV9DDX5_9MICO|nr:non-heme iron oxygenase ferredoxin subunit [Georgenia faecalis]
MSAQHVCDATDLAPGEALRVDLEALDGSPLPVAIVRDEEGDFHAISDICSHGQVNLSDGEVEGRTIECWLHGSTFDLCSGAPLALPATRPVPVYPVTIEGERVLVDVDRTVGDA